MPVKPNKVQAAGVALFADGGIITRAQSITADTDLGVEEIREISNSSIVEFVEGTPTVSIQVEANMNGSRTNLAYFTGKDGITVSGMVMGGTGWKEITPFSFDGTTVDLAMQIQEDNTLKRSMYMPDSFMTSLSWNFDVGGVATESYSLESDDKRMYVGTNKEIMVVSGHYTGLGTAGTSGIYVTPHQEHKVGAYFVSSGFNNTTHATIGWTPIEASLNGRTVVQNVDGTPAIILVPTSAVHFSDNWIVFQGGSILGAVNAGGSAIGAGRWRVVGFKDTANTAINRQTNLLNGVGEWREHTDDIGGIRKGMCEIFLVSGSPQFKTHLTNNEEYFRLQTCSIDVDLAREALEELGNPEAYERTLNFPISATVNFSALDSDIQAWAGFANQRAAYDAGNLVVVGFRDFLQTAGVLIKIYNDDDSNTSRKHLMTITVSGIRVASESFSVDAGGNAIQEFSCSADNFVVS